MQEELDPIARTQPEMLANAFGMVAWPLLVIAESMRILPYSVGKVIPAATTGQTTRGFAPG
jgi:hypothetical protein